VGDDVPLADLSRSGSGSGHEIEVFLPQLLFCNDFSQAAKGQEPQFAKEDPSQKFHRHACRENGAGL
jgi:hypothetical protein